MSLPYFPHEIRLEGVKGVGTIQLQLEPQQQVYCLIGTNGVGKTKLLESLFQEVLFNSKEVENIDKARKFKYSFGVLKEPDIKAEALDFSYKNKHLNFGSPTDKEHNLKFIYIGCHARGHVGAPENQLTALLGTRVDRKTKYIQDIWDAMISGFHSMNMNVNIHTWFVSRAMASNPYQKKEDNRQIEIETVLKLLHQIDQRVDPEFLEITGEPRVFIKIEGQKRELSQLSSGFTSILKIIQSIVSGYGYFTNEVQLQHVAGLVLIDEVESHLHNQWLVKIIPMFKQLFPNTIFIVTTHSPIVLTQLKHGEAYRLQRDDDGVVRSHLINHPDKAAFVDLLNDAFGVDLNQQKLDRISASDQQHVKAQLLDWLSEE